MTKPESPLGLFAIDDLLDDEERATRDTVRRYVDERVRPEIAEWYESGTVPARELTKELGALGLLGMHLEGYGCAGRRRDGVRADLHGARGRRLRHPVAGVGAGVAGDVRDLEARLGGAEAGVAAADGRR